MQSFTLNRIIFKWLFSMRWLCSLNSDCMDTLLQWKYFICNTNAPLMKWRNFLSHQDVCGCIESMSPTMLKVLMIIVTSPCTSLPSGWSHLSTSLWAFSPLVCAACLWQQLSCSIIGWMEPRFEFGLEIHQYKKSTVSLCCDCFSFKWLASF